MSEALTDHPRAPSSAGVEPVEANGAPTATPSVTEALALLLREVAGTKAGLDVVYDALELLRRRCGLDDAIVAVDDETLGVQIFRLGRRAIGPIELDRVRGGESFISIPDTVPREAQQLVGGIAAVAVTRQLAERRRVRDPLTGLLSRAVFNEALRSAAAQSSRYGWTFTVLVLRAGEGESAAEVRRFGHSFARALRSGDTGTRLRRATFAALLPNASADSLHAFIRRFAEESGLSADAIAFASATAPNESVDPAELFRLASSRLVPGDGHPR